MNDDREVDPRVAKGCFRFLVAMLISFGIGGVWGWPYGFIAMAGQLVLIKLVISGD